MHYRPKALCAALFVLPSSLILSAGCGFSPFPTETGQGATAAIMGRLATSAETAKLLAAASGGACPEVRVSINGSPVDIETDDDCAFVIDGVAPSELVTVRVELPDLGVAGTLELADVADGELIEILVEPSDGGLRVALERRATPDPSGDLPTEIRGNNVSIMLPAGAFAEDLSVHGNNFTLVGQAGDGCDDPNGWTVIEGAVSVDGNNAVFRDVYFAGPVELRGNNARFINCCFNGTLVIFGNGARVGGEDDGRHGDDGEDDHGDDDDGDRDDDDGRDDRPDGKDDDVDDDDRDDRYDDDYGADDDDGRADDDVGEDDDGDD